MKLNFYLFLFTTTQILCGASANDCFDTATFFKLNTKSSKVSLYTENMAMNKIDLRCFENLNEIFIVNSFIEKIEFESYRFSDGKYYGLFKLYSNMTVYDKIGVYAYSEIKLITIDVNLNLLKISLIIYYTKHVSSELFRVFKNLTSFDLSRNGIDIYNLKLFGFSDITNDDELLVLKELLLCSNRFKVLTKVLSDVLHQFVNLQLLDFSYNSIESIDPDTFIKLNYLEKLIIIKNPIKYLVHDNFKGLGNLKLLNFSLSNIEIFSSTAFISLKKLTHLDMNSNSLNISELKNQFVGLYNLELLDISRNSIFAIGSIIFQDLVNLKSLILSATKLKYINRYSFENATFKQLKYLSLSCNYIDRIESHSFEYLKSLTSLNLEQSNYFHFLTKETFEDLTNLTALEIKSPQKPIKSIEPNTFQDLKRLISLDLSDHSIVELINFTFLGLDSLKNLNLRKNEIATIYNNAFNGLSNLEILDLSYNPIKKLSGDYFIGLKSLFIIKMYLLSLNSNSIVANSFYNLESLTLIDMDVYKLIKVRAYSFNGLRNLKELRISDCQLTQIEEDAFYGLESIQLIDLSFNKLTNITKNMMKGLGKSLAVLTLRNNRIVNIESYTFKNLTSLEYLDLSYNQLKLLISNQFDGLTKLKFLTLRNNYLYDIESRAFEGLSSLAELSFKQQYITTLKAFMFVGCSSLKNIYFNNFYTLKHIEPFAFFGLDKVEDLNFESFSIKTLVGFSFLGLKNLKRLTLFNIELNSIKKDAFIGLDKLKELNIIENDLTGVEVGSFNGLKSLEKLDLTSNFIKSLDSFYFDSTIIKTNEHPLSIILKNNPLTSFNLFHFNVTTNSNDQFKLRLFYDSSQRVVQRQNNLVKYKSINLPLNISKCNLSEIHLNKDLFLRRTIKHIKVYQSILVRFDSSELDTSSFRFQIKQGEEEAIRYQKFEFLNGLINNSTSSISACSVYFTLMRQYKITRLLIGGGYDNDYNRFLINCLNQDNLF